MADDALPEKLRLFVAMALPGPVRDEIVQVQEELQPLVPCDLVRWTRPDQFHLTLRFLGDVPADRVEDLKQSVQAVCRDIHPVWLCAEGVGFFPNHRSPKVIWVGINDRDGRLVGLQKQIETAVGPFSLEPGERNFTGHVTLGRLKNAKPSDTHNLVSRTPSFQERVFGDWTAGEIEIIRSELSPAGARHTPFAVFRLTFDAEARSFSPRMDTDKHGLKP